jgi:hypothetical protein
LLQQDGKEVHKYLLQLNVASSSLILTTGEGSKKEGRIS